MSSFAGLLLAWYDSEGRDLPWRVKGACADPYRVWLSEIMLQQTTVAAVIPYFQRFTGRWPTVHDLAAAPLEAVLAEWAGLGYYARARNLHACAVKVVELGGFPGNYEGLLTLPGIGPYTAAAISAIAFNIHAPVVDGNVERVITRVNRLADPLPAVKPAIRQIMANITPHDRPGDFAQSLMDLGATVCTPTSPECGRCPVLTLCSGAAEGDATAYPVKPEKKKRPLRFAHAFAAFHEGALRAGRRPPKGLLGGMLEIPTSDWLELQVPPPFPFSADWEDAGVIRHVFTHFEFHVQVWVAKAREKEPGALYIKDATGLPTLYKKILNAALTRREL